METKLPPAFLQRMRALLGPAEFEAFVASYRKPRTHGLRVNTLKIAPDELVRRLGLSLAPVPWCPEGFSCDEAAQPGKHPYHAAGLYYLQEPSAMAAAVLLDPQPGERVLDLCAAPGGKTTHLAQRMGDQGLLVANEIHPARVKALVVNLERFGVKNALVLNESPDRLKARFAAFFDRILVDAPCSGEGMFRKDPDTIKEWDEKQLEPHARRQLAILRSAAAMLRPGGRLVYSTCTFAPEENERVIAQFLDEHPAFDLVAPPPAPHFAPGRPEWADGRPALARAVRLWPHRVRGEGHFLALLEKRPDAGEPEPEAGAAADSRRRMRPRPTGAVADAVALYRRFEGEALTRTLDGDFALVGAFLYRLPDDHDALPDLGGLRIVRFGWPLGAVKKDRFEPGHVLALGLPGDAFRRRADFAADDPAVRAYLRGEPLTRAGEAGWTVVTVDGFPLGWGKQVGGQLKNHYPKGWRWPD